MTGEAFPSRGDMVSALDRVAGFLRCLNTAMGHCLARLSSWVPTSSASEVAAPAGHSLTAGAIAVLSAELQDVQRRLTMFLDDPVLRPTDHYRLRTAVWHLTLSGQHLCGALVPPNDRDHSSTLSSESAEASTSRGAPTQSGSSVSGPAVCESEDGRAIIEAQEHRETMETRICCSEQVLNELFAEYRESDNVLMDHEPSEGSS